jgi:hypothetical protein
MIDFETAIKLGEEVLGTLEKLYKLVYPTTASETPETRSALPNLLQFRRKLLATHVKRHLVTELTATGKLSESEAQAMVDEGTQQTTSVAAAASSPFANILAWLQTNGPTIAQDIVAAIPLLISLLTLFGG